MKEPGLSGAPVFYLGYYISYSNQSQAPPSGGGGGPSGFIPNPPFSATFPGGIGNGQSMVITRSSGTFAAKQFGSGAPWVGDSLDSTYLNGVNVNPYSGLSDGQSIAHLFYAHQSSDGVPTTPMQYFTSRSFRTTYDTAQVATLNMSFNGKGELGVPPWPAAYGSQTNKTLYCSFWGRSKNNFQAVGGGINSNKIFRISNVGDVGSPGENVTMTSGGAAYFGNGHTVSPDTFGTFENFRAPNAGAGLWYRHEVWIDVTAGSAGGGNPLSINGQMIRHWSGVMGLGNPFWTLFNSSVNSSHTFECCHPADVQFAVISPTNVFYDTSGTPMPQIVIAQLGYDDGGDTNGSSGNNYDIAQVYMDPDFQRFEFADSTNWNNGHTGPSFPNREVQIVWNRDSSTQCTIGKMYFGQFPAPSGVSVFYLNSLFGAELVGTFV